MWINESNAYGSGDDGNAHIAQGAGVRRRIRERARSRPVAIVAGQAAKRSEARIAAVGGPQPTRQERSR